jgi:predicted adenine nucleotide alpha hydrolase (AANH) superfamily ATPase
MRAASKYGVRWWQVSARRSTAVSTLQSTPVSTLQRDWQTEAMSQRKYKINADHRFYKQEYCGCK